MAMLLTLVRLLLKDIFLRKENAGSITLLLANSLTKLNTACLADRLIFSSDLSMKVRRFGTLYIRQPTF